LDIDIDTPFAEAINLINNTGATIEFTGPIDIDNVANARGFVATGGGTLEVSNTGNSITTTRGQIVQITDMTTATDGVNFSEIFRTVDGADNIAVELRNNTGGSIVLGTPGDTAGQGGRIERGSMDAVVIENSANVAISGVEIDNQTAGRSGVLVQKTTSGTQTVDLNNLGIQSGALGAVDINIDGGGASAGSLNMTINDTELFGGTNAALLIDDVDNGNLQVLNATIDGNNAGATADGVRINGSNASISFDADTTIQKFSGTDFEVLQGAGTISYAGDIINSTTANPADTSGLTVDIRQRSGGSVTFTTSSNITGQGNEGIFILSNTGGNVSFQGTNILDTGTATALTVNGNTAGTYTFNNFDITTTDGRGVHVNANTGGTYNFNTFDNITTTNGTGVDIEMNNAAAAFNFNELEIVSSQNGQAFRAVGPGTLSVTGLDNRLDATDGTALEITNMTIGAVDFAEVSADGATGPANAIVLRNLTGGEVAIGPATGNFGDGGTLRSTDDAIVLENVQNVDLNQIRILSAGNAAGDHGIQIMHTAAAASTMDVTIDGLDVDAAFDTAVSVTGANNANLFNLRLTDSDLEDRVAMNITGGGGFRLLVDNNDITAAGTDVAFSLDFAGSVQDGDVTIRNGNNFTAANAHAFALTVNGTNASVELRLDNNTFINSSAAAETADTFVDGGATLNANVVNNTFTNMLAADEFEMTSDGPDTRIDLNLSNNSAGAAGFYHLETANNGGNFNFGVVDRDNTNANNVGTVNFDPNINDFESIPGPVEEPSVP
jgi:hypothetical protein